MDAHNATPSRRAVLAGTAGSALVAITSASTSVAASPAVPAPETVALPDGIRPEGITSGPGTTYYVGSLADGRIVTGDLLTGSVATLLPGATGRALRGLRWDPRTGLVWAVGNAGSVSHVWAVDATSGAIVSDTEVPGAGFLNDVVVTTAAVWVTDSRVDRLTRIDLAAGGAPAGGPAAFLPLSGAWPLGNGMFNNANGIRELPDAALILNNSRFGGLWRADTATGVVVPIPVTGGPGIIGGDGLARDGHVLYNVRGSGQREVSVLGLAQAGDAWTAKWLGARTDVSLDVPSTATIAGGWLWAVNARFGVPSPGTASYWITRLPLARA